MWILLSGHLRRRNSFDPGENTRLPPQWSFLGEFWLKGVMKPNMAALPKESGPADLSLRASAVTGRKDNARAGVQAVIMGRNPG